MRRFQLGRLQDRRTERVLRRSHAHETTAGTPVVDEGPDAVPIRTGVVPTDDGRADAATTWMGPPVSDAA